jgi:peptidoglycan L-alanyl-D-glutamate endopeptidase CwlK
MPSRDVSNACERLRMHIGAAMDAYEEANPGLHLKPVEVERTRDEQIADYAKGRTAPGKIVTNCDGTIKLSHHQRQVMHGEAAVHAIDFGVFDANGNYVTEQGPYEAIGEAFADSGLIWGGSWRSFRDRPHVQCLPEGES